ncbi:Programmed cell death protein 5 [Orchesella cincta]|uniref:Programmed cell death protein 5 n=1 Tax=Orchesella cincta TaxID=48709 RepID=A0A1D2MJ28_ORCCI|nr:Programmed cell death protein 5 [Orchesella cincta]
MDNVFGGGSGPANSPSGDAPNQPQGGGDAATETAAGGVQNQVLNQILDQQARARLSTLSLAKPEKAQAVEGMLINMARMGRIGGGKINETQLIDILEKVGGGGPTMFGNSNASGSAAFSRRRTSLDDDDDEEYNKIMEDL